MPGDEVCGITELPERHTFVEFYQRLGMDSLEAKRDFKLAVQTVAKAQATIPDQGRMALHDDTAELGQARGNSGLFGLGDGLGIKETTGVIKFDLLELGQVAAFASRLAKSEVDLPGDGASRHGFVESVLPEIAHQAVPRTFLVGEKNRQAVDKAAVGSALLLQQPGVGAVWV